MNLFDEIPEGFWIFITTCISSIVTLIAAYLGFILTSRISLKEKKIEVLSHSIDKIEAKIELAINALIDINYNIYWDQVYIAHGANYKYKDSFENSTNVLPTIITIYFPKALDLYHEYSDIIYKFNSLKFEVKNKPSVNQVNKIVDVFKELTTQREKLVDFLVRELEFKRDDMNKSIEKT